MQKNKKCQTKRCSKPAKAGRLCYACYRKIWAAKNPVKYAFYNLKYNALRRGKEFTLSFEAFAKFCIESNYIMGKGRTAQSLTIDRHDQNEGYTEKNIKVLPNADNVRKAWRELVYDWRTRDAYVVRYEETKSKIENPF